MTELADHLEIVISENDVDERWQLKDLDGLLSPYREQTRAIDQEMVTAVSLREDSRRV